MMLSKKAISLIYAVFVLQGIGSMLSWNVFITADDYFREKFINTPFEETFLSWFGIIFNITALTTMLVRTFICSSDSISPSRSVWFSLIVITLVISVHIFFTKMPQFHGKFSLQLLGI
jgi:equilibrative nucleoside transporter 1/2/3